MIRRLLMVLLGLAGVGPALCAQTASATASAVVVTPLLVTGLAPLAFGTVFRGINKTVQWNAASSGRVQLGGHAASQLRLTLSFPASLTNGIATMPINSYRVRLNGVNATAGAANVNVVSGVPFNRNLVAGSLWLFIGARVQPSATQATGSYAAPVILSAAYTGL